MYKLIDLLIDAIKSLFIPSDNFFTNWFDNFNEWLGDRFGILYFPIEIVLDFLNRVGALQESTSYVLTVPDLSINIFGNQATLINGFSYDFGSLLENETLANIHNIYLTVVDVILYLCLVVLAYNTFTDVFGGKYMEVVVDEVESSTAEYKDKHRRRVGFNPNDAKK